MRDFFSGIGLGFRHIFKTPVLAVLFCIAVALLVDFGAYVVFPPKPIPVTFATVTPTTVTPTSIPFSPTPTSTDKEIRPDPGYIKVLDFAGYGSEVNEPFSVVVPFKIIWHCIPQYGPHWLRMPVYTMSGKEFPDIVNFTCDKLTGGHGLYTYPPGAYQIHVLSHVPQYWYLLIEVRGISTPPFL